MPDNEVKIKFTTAAELQGAQAAKKSLDDLGQSAQKAEKPIDTLAQRKRSLREVAQGLSVATGRLGSVFGALINPISAATVAVGSFAGLLVSRVKAALEFGSHHVGLTREQIETLRDRMQDAGEGADRFGRHLADLANPTGTVTTRLESLNAALKAEVEYELQLDELRKEKALAEVSAAEAEGRLSPADAEAQRLRIGLKYSRQGIDKRVALNQQLIANRDAAVAEARQEMELTGGNFWVAQEQAKKSAQALAIAQAVAERDRLAVSTAQQEMDSMKVMGMPVGSPRHQEALQEAIRREDNSRAALREATRRAESDKQLLDAAKAAADEAAGRYGGLNTSGEARRLRAENEFFRKSGGLSEQIMGIGSATRLGTIRRQGVQQQEKLASDAVGRALDGGAARYERATGRLESAVSRVIESAPNLERLAIMFERLADEQEKLKSRERNQR